MIDKPNLGKKFTEKQLQKYIGSKLKEYGFSVSYEVEINGGFADIVTSWQDGVIIEVKKFLDRDAIYQASGQLVNVYGRGNNHKLLIAGFHVSNPKEKSSALTTASMIKSDRLSVLFI